MHQRESFRLALWLVAIVLATKAPFANAQATLSTWTAFDMGFGQHSSGETILTSVVGGPFAGSTKALNTIVQGGFLAGYEVYGTIVAVKGGQLELPKTFSLAQNFPNPFNPSTTIRFDLPHASRVSLKVYNVLGQEVITLVDEEKPAGTYDVQFNAVNLSSGMYVYRIQAGDFVSTKKLILLK